jgi:hypothetical protein
MTISDDLQSLVFALTKRCIWCGVFIYRMAIKLSKIILEPQTKLDTPPC